MAIKETIPFNFDEIYSYIEKKFKDKGYDIEEGSNAMQLVTAMSYLTSMLNANTAVNINETILTLARKRNNVIRDARVLGYEIDHIQSYKYRLILNFSNVGTYSIKKYTSFSLGDYTYYYMGNDLEEFQVQSGDLTEKSFCAGLSQEQVEFLGGDWDPNLHIGTNISQIDCEQYNGEYITYTGVLVDIDVVEGVLHKYVDNPNTLVKVIQDENVINPITNDITTTTQYFMDIPFVDIEENGLDVYLTYVDETGSIHEKELWEKTKVFMIDSDTVMHKEYIRLDNVDYRTPRIYFRLGDVGKDLRVGTFIHVNALESSGVNGALTDNPTPNELDCEVVARKLLLQGTEEESIESIKLNAPLFHNTANRIITKPDYIAVCNRQSPIKSSYVWDGHDEQPNKPGHIWFSFLPSTNIREITPIDPSTSSNYVLSLEQDRINWYIEDNEVTNTWDYLNDYKIPTLVFHHRHPIYYNFDFQVQIVKYNVSSTRKEQHDIIFNLINDFFLSKEINSGAESFGYEYFHSNLLRKIDSILNDDNGVNMLVSNTIELTENNYHEELVVDDQVFPHVYYREILVHLGMPFERVIDENHDIDTDVLPDISTLNFVGSSSLTVDFNTPTVTMLNITDRIFEYPIILGSSTIIGTYRVYDVPGASIELVFKVIGPGGYNTGLSVNDLANTLKISVSYPTPNINFIRNTIPRLRSVTFVSSGTVMNTVDGGVY